jgi:predicted sugar kinase
VGPFQEIHTTVGLGDLVPTFIINDLLNAIQDRDINTFLNMISHMKTSLNDYYNTTDSDEQKRILKQLAKKIRQYSGGSVKKQKTKKQKPLRKNNSFRKKRKAKV